MWLERRILAKLYGEAVGRPGVLHVLAVTGLLSQGSGWLEQHSADCFV